MVDKVYLDPEGFVSLTCPNCKKSFRKNLSNYKSSNRQINLKCHCLCGCSFSAILDRRKHLRKKTRLTGAYIHDKKQTRGLINIKDLSRSGIGFELGSDNKDYIISTGDILTVRFTLDDVFQTLISKEVLTKRVKGKFIGNEFLDILYEHDLLHLYLNNYLS
jgi:hypothetical protein